VFGQLTQNKGGAATCRAIRKPFRSWGEAEGAEPGEGGQNFQNEGPKGPNKERRSSGDQEVDLEGLYSVE
jgi:hypothetical protein